MANPLATARQLWRLNQDGRLALVDVGNEVTPIPSTVADAAIKAGIAAGTVRLADVAAEHVAMLTAMDARSTA